MTKPIQTAICSFGMSGKVFHAPFIHASPLFCLVGVWERSKKIARQSYPDIISYDTLEEVLEDDQVELVIVNTPSVTHYEYARKVLLAEKNVLIEKPFTASAKQAQDLIALAEERKVSLSVFHNRRYDSDFLTVQKVLARNVLGRLVEMELHFDRFHPNLSYKSHKEVPTEAVGSLYDLGSHLIDQALVLFGMPLEIYADLDILRSDSKVVDYFDIKLYYNSFRVILKSSYFVKKPQAAYILHGHLGSFIKERADPQEVDLIAGVSPVDTDFGLEPSATHGSLYLDDTVEKLPSERGCYMTFFDVLHDGIRDGGRMPVSGAEAMQVIKIIELAIKSDMVKRRVKL